MKSVRLQLLVTLVATVVVAGVFAIRGLPPGMGIHYGAIGDVRMVQQNMRWGVDVNAKDVRLIYPTYATGERPLHTAALCNSRAVAEFLIAKGADVHARDIWGMTPLHSAAYNNTRAVAELLIANGADVKARDNEGMTPLHRSAWHGDKDVAELLIAKGADVNATNNEGRTPLQLAIEVGKWKVEDLLLSHGAKE